MIKNSKGIVYKITNIENNKCYIGVTSYSFNEYINKHFINALTNKDNNKKYFYNAIRKYGVNNFKCEILGYCNSKEEIIDSEITCINFFKSNNSLYGYNMTKGGEGGYGHIKGHTISKEAKEKIGKANSINLKGKKHTEERNKRKSERMTGHFTSKETRDKISAKNKGKKRTKEHIDNWINSFKGYKHTDETKKKISEANKGKPSWNKGQKGVRNHTDETKKKISEALIGKKKSKESILKQKNLKWINKNNKNKRVPSEVLQQYLNEGWKLGHL